MEMGRVFRPKKILFEWTIFHLLFALYQAQQCGEQSEGNNFVFQTILHMHYQGPNFDVGRQVNAANALGNCRNTTVHAERLFNYFSGYGQNLTGVMRDPHVVHDEAGFYLTPLHDDQFKGLIYSASLYRYTKVLNIPVGFAEWSLTAKVDSVGPEGTLLAGHTLSFGMFRFSMSGRTVCIEYNSRRPVDYSAYTTGVFPLDLEIRENIWGRGSMRGLAVIGDDGRVTLDSMFLFPVDDPTDL